MAQDIERPTSGETCAECNGDAIVIIAGVPYCHVHAQIEMPGYENCLPVVVAREFQKDPETHIRAMAEAKPQNCF